MRVLEWQLLVVSPIMAKHKFHPPNILFSVYLLIFLTHLGSSS